MASRGRGRRGRPRGTGQAPPTFDQPPFDQRAFVETVGVVVAAIAQASIAGSQRDPNNPQRFRTHHPPTFTGGGGGGGGERSDGGRPLVNVDRESVRDYGDYL